MTSPVSSAILVISKPKSNGCWQYHDFHLKARTTQYIVFWKNSLHIDSAECDSGKIVVVF